MRIYEVVDGAEPLQEAGDFKSSVPQAGFAMLPKLSNDVMKCEIGRILKLQESSVVPIRFEVTRQVRCFSSLLHLPLKYSMYFFLCLHVCLCFRRTPAMSSSQTCTQTPGTPTQFTPPRSGWAVLRRSPHSSRSLDSKPRNPKRRW